MRIAMLAASLLGTSALAIGQPLLVRDAHPRLEHLGPVNSTGATTSEIPPQFQGRWAFQFRACDIRDEMEAMEAGGFRISAREISGFEATYKFVRKLPSAQGTFAFRATELIEGDGGRGTATVMLRMEGQRLSLASSTGLKYTLARCRPASRSTSHAMVPADVIPSSTESDGVRWTNSRSGHDVLMVSRKGRIIIGADCKAHSSRYGEGTWGWANGGFVINFARTEIAFPRATEPGADSAGACRF